MLPTGEFATVEFNRRVAADPQPIWLAGILNGKSARDSGARTKRFGA
jgi:hypothetical protein